MGRVGHWVIALVLPIAAVAETGLEVGQEKRVPPPKPAGRVLPPGKAAAPPAPKSESAEKRRERMKARDAEIDRMLKEKQKQKGSR